RTRWSEPAAKGPPSSGEAAKGADSVEEGDARLIRVVGKTAGLLVDPRTTMPELRRYVTGGDPERLRVLVMTVPSPWRTRCAWEFDQAVDSLLAAAGDWGLLLDRSDIAWSREANPANETAPGAKARWRYPGLVVLRSPPPGPLHLVVVLLVGESPVDG